MGDDYHCGPRHRAWLEVEQTSLKGQGVEALGEPSRRRRKRHLGCAGRRRLRPPLQTPAETRRSGNPLYFTACSFSWEVRAGLGRECGGLCSLGSEWVWLPSRLQAARASWTCPYVPTEALLTWRGQGPGALPADPGGPLRCEGGKEPGRFSFLFVAQPRLAGEGLQSVVRAWVY